MNQPQSSIIDLSDFPELPPPPGVYTSDAVAEEEPTIVEVIAPPEPKKRPINRNGGRKKKGQEPPPPTITDRDLKIDEHNHFKIRKDAQKRVPLAWKVIDELLDPESALHAAATPAQLLKATEMIFDRAGDKPATAAAAPKEDSTEDYILMDRSQLPTIH